MRKSVHFRAEHCKKNWLLSQFASNESCKELISL